MTAVLGIAQAQAELGHKITITTTDFGHPVLPQIKGVSIHSFPCQFSKWRWSKQLGVSLFSLMKETDMVHLHMLWEYPILAAARAAFRINKPYIVSPCGMLDRWSLSQKSHKKKIYLKLFGKILLKRASAIHFTSEQEQANAGIPIPNSQSVICPLGVNREAYENLPSIHAFSKRFPVLKDRKIILFLGRLHYKKQPDLLIQAFAESFKVDSNSYLVLAGPGEPAYLKKLKQLAEDLKIQNQIIFTGNLEREAVREAYVAAHLFVLPSLQENFGLSVVEAMAAGCPVLVSDKVNFSKEIREAQAGVICLPTLEAVTSGMISILKDENRRQEIGEKGQRLILQRFTWDKVIKDLMGTYKAILAKDKGKGLR